MNSEQQLLDYSRVEKAIDFIVDHQLYQPSLNDIAASEKMSPDHFQRMFKRWAGISPKKFLQYITLEKSKERLARGASLTETAYQAGLSGTGRLHDLYTRFEGMTPGQYKNQGRGLKLFYSLFPSIFGQFILAVTAEGNICHLAFTDNPELSVIEFRQLWNNASIAEDHRITSQVAQKILNPVKGDYVTVMAKGTEFQLKVWEALLKIPAGAVVSYETIAALAGNPKALQAVGGAIGSNPVAYLIPCHRVIRKAGNINQYRWGQKRKMAIIGWEACLAEEEV